MVELRGVLFERLVLGYVGMSKLKELFATLSPLNFPILRWEEKLMSLITE